jgi:hypothetical protein
MAPSSGPAAWGHLVRDNLKGLGGALNAGAQRVSRTGRQAYEQAGDAQWARDLLGKLPRPAAPVAEPWSLSIGSLVGQHPQVPAAVPRLLNPLRRVGELAISPGEVGFDGERVPWGRVTQIRTRTALAMFLDAAVEQEIERIRAVLPPVPGRKWAAAKVADLLGTLLLAAAGQFEGPDLQIPCEIGYKSAMRRDRQMTTGLIGAAIMAGVPEVGMSIEATARARGIPILPAARGDLSARTDKAERLREVSASLASRLRAITAGNPNREENLPADEESIQPGGAVAVGGPSEAPEQPGENRPAISGESADSASQ